MTPYEIRCEVVDVRTKDSVSPGSAKCKDGETYTIGARTPEPNGMCQRARHAVHPTAFALRWTEKMAWETEDFIDVVCPDDFVTYGRSRIRKE